MKVRTILALCSLAWCFGCQKTQMAKDLVTPKTFDSEFWMTFTPTGDQMVERGKADVSRRIPVDDELLMDVAVIRAKSEGNRKKALGTMLMLHNLRENKTSYPYQGAGERLAGKGYDVVLTDLRAHGRSDGEYVTYGVKEKDDLKRIMDILISQKLVSPDVYVFGSNYGATIAIQYAAIDPRVKGVLAVAPYKDFRSLARQSLKLKLRSDEDIEEIVAEAGRIGDFDPDEASAVGAAPKLNCPILLVHGLINPTVPMAHSEEILAAAPEPKELVVPAAEQFIMPAILEDWIADRMAELAQKGVQKTPPPLSAAK